MALDTSTLTPEQAKIASVVYNAITGEDNAIDFDNEVTASSGMTLLSINPQTMGAGYVQVATLSEVEAALEEVWT